MRSLINALSRAAAAAERAGSRALDGSGLSPGQYELLVAVTDNPGVTGAELRDRIPGYLRHRASIDANALEREKLIVRKIQPGDARQRSYWPTEKGKARAAALKRAFDEAELAVGMAVRHIKVGTLYDALTTIAVNAGGDDATAA